MPIREMIEIRTCGTRRKKLELLLATQCAPFLCKLAIANVLTIDTDDVAMFIIMLKSMKVKAKILYRKENWVVLYLYRAEMLQKYLDKTEIRLFLMEQGYYENDLTGLINHFALRINTYYEGDSDYPHEMGIFLGYPLEDVKGFIENDGKGFLHMGYWKVYHNPEESIERFRMFDQKREWMVREVISGKSIRKLCVERS